jgi:hypothetical protein
VNPRYTDENTERLGKRLDAVRDTLATEPRAWAKQFWAYTYTRLNQLWRLQVHLRQVQHKEFVQKPTYAIRYDWFEPDARMYNYVDDVASRVFGKFKRPEFGTEFNRLANIRKSLNEK